MINLYYISYGFLMYLRRFLLLIETFISNIFLLVSIFKKKIEIDYNIININNFKFDLESSNTKTN